MKSDTHKPVDNDIPNALEKLEIERLKVIANLNVMLGLGDEVCEEAIPNYQGDPDESLANEMYTIIDWQLNSRKLKKIYEKEIEALTGVETVEAALKKLKNHE